MGGPKTDFRFRVVISVVVTLVSLGFQMLGLNSSINTVYLHYSSGFHLVGWDPKVGQVMAVL